MKKWMQNGLYSVLMFACLFFFGINAEAQEANIIKTGIYAGDIDLSGMNEEEANAAINAYLDELRTTEITLIAAKDTPVKVTAGDMGLTWANPEMVDEALEIGTTGNVIERYKTIKDLEHDGLKFAIEISYDMQAISDVLTRKCAVYDVAAIDSTLTRTNGEFEIQMGRTGYALDVETSIDRIYGFLLNEWNYQPDTIALDVAVTNYRGSVEELSQVKDVLGSYTTAYKSSGSNRSANIQNGCELIDGALLYPGDEFSSLDEVLPFTEANGYFPAGSYLNGQVVDSLGGGICQVTTTLYNAVLLAELDVTERYNHSMTVSYVKLAFDAAIAESAGKDFKFVNNTDHPIYIEGYIKDKTITFNIYGKETRSADRKVQYESVLVQEIPSSPDIITADAGHSIGYITTKGGYTGYKTQLWKIVTENGEEVSRTKVNNSNYKMVQRTATVGIATDDEWAYNEIMAAIGTANIDHVKNVIAQLTAPPPEYDDEDEEW